MTNKDYINSIRDDYSGLKDRLRAVILNSVKILADDLYAKDSHFIFELIQNAEDNNYPDQSEARLSFEVCLINIEGQNETALIVKNNEIGFNDKNVSAICHVGQTTKKKMDGYIGEKGIGFKSVFRITSRPYIFSNGFQFCLPEKDDETGLGYIVPCWVERPPHEISTAETTIILPLNKKEKDIDDVIKSLREISPETILFLKKLKSLEVSIQLSSSDSFKSLSINKKVLKTIGNSQLIELRCQKSDIQNDAEVDVCNYWVTEIDFEKPIHVHHEKRIGIECRTVSVAIPLNDKPSKGKLFAYLPVWEETGIPFLVNADFLLVSSRESIHEKEDWNIWLRDCVVKTYTSSLLTLLNASKISFKIKVFGYASIPVKTNYQFLQPIIDNVIKELSERACVLTLPDKLLVNPSKTMFCYNNFRELLAESESLPVHFVENVQIICPEIEMFSVGLKAIGVKIFTLQDVLSCLEDTKWLKEHDLQWFLKLFRYLKTHKLKPSSLKEKQIVPIKRNKKINLSCNKDQPIYYSFNEDDKASFEKVPEWLSTLVPIVEINRDFETLLNTQKDYDDLKIWMSTALKIDNFSKEKFCVAIFSKLKEGFNQLSSEQLLEATQWLNNNVGENSDWADLPIVLADGKKILARDACKLNLVVPEQYCQESGWQNIWSETKDQAHFVALNNLYMVMPKKWFISIGAKNYPPFASINYVWYSNLLTIPYLFNEALLLKECIAHAASSRREDTTLTSYSLPAILEKLPQDEKILKLLSCSLLSYLHQLNMPDSNVTAWKRKYDLSNLGLYAKGTYENRGAYTKYSPSCILHQLRQLEWFPTTKGYAKPSQAFLPKKSIKEVLGDTVPYYEEILQEDICQLLEVKSEVTVNALIGLLRYHSGSDNPNQEMIERVYTELLVRSERNNDINSIFSNESLIYISVSQKDKKWLKSDECIWEDATDILGDEFSYLQKQYPDMKKFFINRLGVKERIDTECYAKCWLKNQEAPLDNIKKQRELLERLYCEIKPVALQSEDDRPEWWDDYFFDQAKFYSQADTFRDASELFISDDRYFQTMFKDTEDVEFAWRPEQGSFSDWKSFFSIFNIPLLSESVTESLVEDVIPEILKNNHYVTESAIKMIASWFAEKRQAEYEALLSKDTFKHLLLLRESSFTTDIEIEFCLKTDFIIESKNGLYPAFLDRNAHILYYNGEISKNKLAQALAKFLAKNYKDLADWIELVLGADNIERIKDKNWNVPREINDLFREKKLAPFFDKDSLEESITTTITPAIEHIGNNDASSIESGAVFCGGQKETETAEAFKTIPKNPLPVIEVILATADATKNKADKPESKPIQHENPIGIDKEVPVIPDTTSFNYIASLKVAFTQNGSTELNKDVISQINSRDDGILSNSSRRAEKLAKAYSENIKKEPSAEARRKETERSLLEPPNEAVRASLFEWYQGSCQICDERWPKKDGYPYFTAAYIVERQFKRWLDEPGNALCLCAKHFAQWKLAAKHSTTEIMGQISKLKLNNEGGDGDLSIHLSLAGHKISIRFCERHALALRKLIDATTGINPEIN